MMVIHNRIFITLGINGGYSGWSAPKKCTQSCGGGVRLRKRKCNNPKPSLNGKDCYGPNKRLAAAEWCNVQVNYTDGEHLTKHNVPTEQHSTVTFAVFLINRAVQERKIIVIDSARPLAIRLIRITSEEKVRLAALNVSQHSQVLVDMYCNTSIERRYFEQRSTVTFSKNAVLFHLASPQPINLSHDDYRCGFKMLHEIWLARENVKPIKFPVTLFQPAFVVRMRKV